MFTKKFWVDALERAVRTFCQFMIAGGVMDPLSIDFQTSLQTKLVAAGVGALTSILMALAGSGFGQKDSASFIDVKGDDGHTDWQTALLAAAVSVVVWLVMWKLMIKE